jgi:low affinity Fe/Cu permease
MAASMKSERVRRGLTRLGVFVAHPAAFLILLAYAVLWFIFQPRTFDWQAVATLTVWAMTLLIQRTEHRDTQAIHAKLDELIRTQAQASNDLITIDKKEPEDIVQIRKEDRH